MSSTSPDSTPARPKVRRYRRWLWRSLGGLTMTLAILVAVVVVQGRVAFGKSASGDQLAAIEASPHWQDGVFVNPQPLWNSVWLGLHSTWNRSEHSSPGAPLPVVPYDPERLADAPPSGLRVTWLGHSTMLIEIDGRRVLTDPVWGERTSPLTWVGPKRWYPPPIPLDSIPTVDAVILSHDHYDHLDYPTIVAMKGWDTTFVAPLGVGAHLAYWGVPPDRIVELDWWDRRSFGDLEIVATPARHASGRHLFDQDHTLWAGYALVGPTQRVFFSGDTGLFPAMEEIGARLGPFDVTMIEVGAYDQAWPDWHLGPEQAVIAHRMLRGKVLMPVHWGLFDLANHGWTEPIERVIVAANEAGVELVSPRPGDSFEPSAPPHLERWWPQLPWRTTEDYPVRSRPFD